MPPRMPPNRSKDRLSRGRWTKDLGDGYVDERANDEGATSNVSWSATATTLPGKSPQLADALSSLYLIERPLPIRTRPTGLRAR